MFTLHTITRGEPGLVLPGANPVAFTQQKNFDIFRFLQDKLLLSSIFLLEKKTEITIA